VDGWDDSKLTHSSLTADTLKVNFPHRRQTSCSLSPATHLLKAPSNLYNDDENLMSKFLSKKNKVSDKDCFFIGIRYLCLHVRIKIIISPLINKQLS